jgi:hypothetical protein
MSGPVVVPLPRKDRPHEGDCGPRDPIEDIGR